MATPEQSPEQLAYQRGVEAGRINARLVILEDHRKTVNGQLVRLADTQDKMNDRLDGVIKRLDEAALVNQTLAKAAEQSGARKLSRWQLSGFVIGVPVGIVTILLYVLEAVKGLH